MPTQTHRVSRRRTKIMGLLGPGVLTPEPARIEGTRQKAGAFVPPACPHCRVEPPGWVCDERRGECRICGETWYRTVSTYRLPPPKNTEHPRPVWLPNMQKGA